MQRRTASETATDGISTSFTAAVRPSGERRKRATTTPGRARTRQFSVTFSLVTAAHRLVRESRKGIWHAHRQQRRRPEFGLYRTSVQLVWEAELVLSKVRLHICIGTASPSAHHLCYCGATCGGIMTFPKFWMSRAPVVCSTNESGNNAQGLCISKHGQWLIRDAERRHSNEVFSFSSP